MPLALLPGVRRFAWTDWVSCRYILRWRRNLPLNGDRPFKPLCGSCRGMTYKDRAIRGLRSISGSQGNEDRFTGWMLGYSQKAELHQAHISVPFSSQSARSGDCNESVPAFHSTPPAGSLGRLPDGLMRSRRSHQSRDWFVTLNATNITRHFPLQKVVRGETSFACADKTLPT